MNLHSGGLIAVSNGASVLMSTCENDAGRIIIGTSGLYGGLTSNGAVASLVEFQNKRGGAVRHGRR